MKKLLLFSKILMFVWSVLLILIVIGIPLSMTFTTNDRAPSLSFFISNAIEFLPLWLPLLLLLVPVIALKSFASFRVGDIGDAEFKKRIFVYSVAEIVLIIAFSALLIYINASNSAGLL